MFGKKDAKSKASKSRKVEAGRDMADCGSRGCNDSKSSKNCSK